VDGVEEIAVDKSPETIFEHDNISFLNQRITFYPPKISTSLPTDFVRNFCRLITHFERKVMAAGRQSRYLPFPLSAARTATLSAQALRQQSHTFSMHMAVIAD
jgi:hypothetical protein